MHVELRLSTNCPHSLRAPVDNRIADIWSCRKQDNESTLSNLDKFRSRQSLVPTYRLLEVLMHSFSGAGELGWHAIFHSCEIRASVEHWVFARNHPYRWNPNSAEAHGKTNVWREVRKKCRWRQCIDKEPRWNKFPRGNVWSSDVTCYDVGTCLTTCLFFIT